MTCLTVPAGEEEVRQDTRRQNARHMHIPSVAFFFPHLPSHAFPALWQLPISLATSVLSAQECRQQKCVWSH